MKEMIEEKEVSRIESKYPHKYHESLFKKVSQIRMVSLLSVDRHTKPNREGTTREEDIFRLEDSIDTGIVYSS